MSDLATKGRMADALAALALEFDRINNLHFAGKHTRPRIEFSLRKSFGGYYQNRAHRIVLSWQAFCEYGWEETINTFRHEIAHIVYMDHSPAFWRLAFQLGVTRKYAREPLKQRYQRILVYQCPACGKKVQRKRRIANSSCASCDRKYNPNFRLQLIEVKLKTPPPEKPAPAAPTPAKSAVPVAMADQQTLYLV
jgi:predicted SprT family Zn-dependent metalloprotease